MTSLGFSLTAAWVLRKMGLTTNYNNNYSVVERISFTVVRVFDFILDCLIFRSVIFIYKHKKDGENYIALVARIEHFMDYDLLVSNLSVYNL